MVGQIWFDKQDTRLKVYDGTNFRAPLIPIVSATNSNKFNYW